MGPTLMRSPVSHLLTLCNPIPVNPTMILAPTHPTTLIVTLNVAHAAIRLVTSTSSPHAALVVLAYAATAVPEFAAVVASSGASMVKLTQP